MINIAGLDKARVLKALYNASKPQGLGILMPGSEDSMTYEQARNVLDAPNVDSGYFDYLRGRVLKVDLSGDMLDPRLYDRDNGPGAAENAILQEFCDG